MRDRSSPCTTSTFLLLTCCHCRDRSVCSVDIHKSFCISSQRISKFKESADKANVVQIYMAVLRLKAVTTDLLISFNVPMQFAAGSSSEGRSILNSAENVAVIQGVLKTLTIKDWSLFGQSTSSA
jgi:L-lactate utilization protein LutB